MSRPRNLETHLSDYHMLSPNETGAVIRDAQRRARQAGHQETPSLAGCLIELYGPESCGKTTAALRGVLQAQRVGRTTAWLDADGTFDAEYADSVGVDLARMALLQPSSGAQTLDIAKTLVESRSVAFVVIDSAQGLHHGPIPTEITDEPMIERGELVARMVSRELRIIIDLLTDHHGCVAICSTVQEAPDGATIATSPASFALRRHAHLSLDARNLLTNGHVLRP